MLKGLRMITFLVRKLQGMSTARYVFMSHFGTLLTSSDEGLLYHAFPEEIKPNIIANSHGHIVDAPEFIKDKLSATSVTEGFFSVSSVKGYLCADIGGAIGWRPHCLDLERFRLLSWDEYNYRRQIDPVNFNENIRKYSISRIIHQTHDEDIIPEHFLPGVERLRAYNPSWEYIYWNEKDRLDFIYQYYGWKVLKAYLSINPRYGAARADLFRYLCIYKLGGIYLDLKSTTNISFDDLVHPEDQYLLSQWRNGQGESSEGCGLGPEVACVKGGEFQQWHIAAAAGHPFLKNVIHNTLTRIRLYSEDYFGGGKLSVLRVTGPYVYTMSIYPNLQKYPHRFFDAEKDGLVYSFVGDHTKLFTKHYSRETTPLIL